MKRRERSRVKNIANMLCENSRVGGRSSRGKKVRVSSGGLREGGELNKIGFFV
jgi:hypothetical protein